MHADPKTQTPRSGAQRRRTGWWWVLLCLVASIGLATVILVRFGWQFWTAILLLVLMFCPLALVWGVIQSLRGTPLVVGPVPETRGVTIDWLAPAYDQMCRVMGLGPAMRRRTLALAGLQRGERVLDVGCGTGVLTRLAAEAIGPAGTAVGIDPGPAMIGVARLKAVRTRSRAKFELGVIERLSFGDGTFDVVLSSFMLHHLPADVKRAGLGEAWRVLKPGGRLVLVDFDPRRPIARLMFAIFRLVPTYARVLHAAGDPAPLLRAARFVDVTAVGSWIGAATFWAARKPLVTATPVRPSNESTGQSAQINGQTGDLGLAHIGGAPARGTRRIITRRLEPMLIAETVTYGNYFQLSGEGPYRIDLSITRPGSATAVKVEFTYEHRT
jgi:ubiquinone/menaquinone biosynthesis C-methylase UbiE